VHVFALYLFGSYSVFMIFFFSQHAVRKEDERLLEPFIKAKATYFLFKIICTF